MWLPPQLEETQAAAFAQVSISSMAPAPYPPFASEDTIDEAHHKGFVSCIPGDPWRPYEVVILKRKGVRALGH